MLKLMYGLTKEQMYQVAEEVQKADWRELAVQIAEDEEIILTDKDIDQIAEDTLSMMIENGGFNGDDEGNVLVNLVLSYKKG